MDLTCLSEGGGYYIPSCNILDICGFRVLFDCPIDFSSLAIFSPVPVDSIWTGADDSRVSYAGDGVNEVETSRMKKPLDSNSLITAEPRYKFVRNLFLWDFSFVDVVLISSPMGMMGLPFLARNEHFSAKVYATEVAAKFGQLMMEDLVDMHKEFRQFYGPEDSGAPQWMKWENLELLPLELKKIVLGENETEFGGWMPLYSSADIKDCMAKIKPLKYAEEVYYNGTLIIKAFSSGLEIGSCNWSITGPKGRIAYISSSVFSSGAAMSFNYEALQKHDVTLFSDVSSCKASYKFEINNKFSVPTSNSSSNSSNDLDQEASGIFHIVNELEEEMEKLDFICSCSMDSVNAGGSVLIPIGRIGIILQLLERFSLGLESENMKVPIYVVSSVAEELISFTNAIPEWVCKQRQDRLYSGQPIFSHVDMLTEGRVHLFSAVHSLKLLSTWQEPCIVFCPHWSLRLGPAVHFIRRWHRDKNSLLVMEEGLDASLVLLPFKPLEMKVLQCSFNSGVQLQYSCHLLKNLQSAHVLFPEISRQHISQLESLFSIDYFFENKLLHIPNARGNSELDISMEVASQLRYTTLGTIDTNFAKLKGELVIEQGRYRLSLGNGLTSSQIRPPVQCFGRIDLNDLLSALQKSGLDATVTDKTGSSSNATMLHISKPSQATIEVTEAQTLVCTDNESLASIISKAICSILHCL